MTASNTLTTKTQLKSVRISLDLIEALPHDVAFSAYINAALRAALTKDRLLTTHEAQTA